MSHFAPPGRRILQGWGRLRVGALAAGFAACSGQIGGDDLGPPGAATTGGADGTGGRTITSGKPTGGAQPEPPVPAGQPTAGSPNPTGMVPAAATPGTTPGPAVDLVPMPPGQPSGNSLSIADLACKGTDQGATRSRLVRLTGDQYTKTIASALGGRTLGKDFVVPFTYVAAADRYSTLATSYTMTDDELVASFTAAELGGTQLALGAKGDATGCLSRTLATPDLSDCLRKTIGQVGQALFRRPLTADETAGFAKVAMDNLDGLGGGRDAAVALAFQTMLMAPDFLYRSELGTGAPDAQGRRRLGVWELASAISYTLADAPPDAALQAAAAAGKLSTPDEIGAQVARYVGTPEKGSPRFFDFMREYLGWDRPSGHDEIAIDRITKEGYFRPVTYGAWDNRATVKKWLAQNGRKEFWKTALTSNQFVIRGFTFPAWDLLRSVYEKENGVKVELEKDLPITFPARTGFLSLPTFMMNLSTFNGENMAVQRGRWIRENLFCKDVPELPIGTVTALPEGNTTLREKLKVHNQMPGCVACHRFMDPLGLVFEGHDYVGRTITTDHGKPIDESGAIVDSGSDATSIDGPVVGIPQLATTLATSSDVEFCFVRQNLRFLMGRNEESFDGCTVAKVRAAYRAGGGDYVALLVALFTSDSFLYRKGVTP